MLKYLKFLLQITIILIFSTANITFAGSPPKAVIEIQKGELLKEVPFSLNLDGSGSSDPEKSKLKYLWQYPENKIIESKNPRSYRFEKAGTYDIELTVTDEEGLSDTATMQIVAKEKVKKTKTKSKNKKKSTEKSKKTTKTKKSTKIELNNDEKPEQSEKPKENWINYLTALSLIVGSTLIWLKNKTRQRRS